jgi:hypothetical protein
MGFRRTPGLAAVAEPGTAVTAATAEAALAFRFSAV